MSYTAIATTTLSSPDAIVDFSSIPGTYKHLQLVITATNTGGNADLFLRVNDDTGTNYDYVWLSQNSSNAVDNTANVRMGYYALPETYNRYTSITYLNNYTSSNNKTWFTRAAGAGVGMDFVAATWRNTAAITKLTIRANTSSFGTGSTFTLFGVSA